MTDRVGCGSIATVLAEVFVVNCNPIAGPASVEMVKRWGQDAALAADAPVMAVSPRRPGVRAGWTILNLSFAPRSPLPIPVAMISAAITSPTGTAWIWDGSRKRTWSQSRDRPALLPLLLPN
jgi:hypothetical protein